MFKKKEYWSLIYVGKKIIPKKTFKKIRSIKELEERTNLLKYGG